MMVTKKKTKKKKSVVGAEKSDTLSAGKKKKVTKKKVAPISEVELKPVKPENESKRTPPVRAIFGMERVITENTNEARNLYIQSRYGTVLENGQLQLSLHEGLYLMEKGKILVCDQRNKQLSFMMFMKKAKKIEPNFWVRYSVFKDMRNRGYIIKTALKFGADFRVYDRGVKPGEDHARWVVYPVHEGSTLTWYEFAAKNRVAHSTKKRLMLAVVDDETDVTYWEVKWVRP